MVRFDGFDFFSQRTVCGFLFDSDSRCCLSFRFPAKGGSGLMNSFIDFYAKLSPDIDPIYAKAEKDA